MMKLDVRAFGLALGCFWSASMLLLGFMSSITSWGEKIVRLFSTVYIGYRGTPVGSLIGAFWGFLDGAISGILIAWIYNKLAT